ncbi:MAG: HAD-IA family hydrolase [Rhizobiaceae bacterium]|nr:HAD-IA family hydrolase [Rhizobiaceae bacterium]
MIRQSASALVLDFGGVVTKTLFETHDLTEDSLGLKPGTLTWQGPFAPESDPLWQAMIRDEITEREYWLSRAREVGTLLGEKWDRMDAFVRRARGADPSAVIRPEALAAIRKIKENGHRLAILSNELDLFYGKDFRKRLAFIDLFDVIVDATYTNILKPDPRAYALVTDALSLPASACVFVDDQPRNVKGGIASGMRCVQFDVRTPEESFSEALSYFGLALTDHSNQLTGT